MKFGFYRNVVGVGLTIALLTTAVGCQDAGKKASDGDKGTTTEATTDNASGGDTKAPDAKASGGKKARTSPFREKNIFPKAEAGYTIVADKDYSAYASAKLMKDNKEVAILSIGDASKNPKETQGFQSKSIIAGYPAQISKKQTKLLVANRYLVRVGSTADDFTDKDRAAWIQKFNLDTLATLK